MKRLYILSIIVSVVISANAAGMDFIPLAGHAPGEVVARNIIRSDVSTYQVKITINGLYDRVLENEHGTFHRLSFGNCNCLMNPGKPALPVLNQLVAIPSGMKAKATITEIKWSEMEVGTVFPAQELLEEGAKPKPFIQDSDAYAHDYLPELCLSGREMDWRGIRNVCFSVCPFKYYPQEGKLSVLEEFILRIDFRPLDGSIRSRNILLEETKDYGMFCNSFFTRSPGERQPARTSSNIYDYLIIVDNSTILNSDKLKEFVRWKALKGLKTKVIPKSQIGSTATAIKNRILQESVSGVQYVLLVGTESDIPAKGFTSLNNSSKTFASDYWYGCLGGDNDYLADIPVGRFSTSQLSEFANMVDKTIKYEMGQNLSDKVLLVAHQDGSGSSDGYQSCCENIRTSHLSDATFYTAYGASVAEGGNNATNADVIAYINQGCHIVNYRGHGAYNSWGGSDWGDPYWNASNQTFFGSEVNNMSSNTNAVFFSVSCHTGDIGTGMSMLETLTRSPKGASAFVGSTTNSYTMPNHTYDVNLFHELYDIGTHHLGDVNMAAQILNIQTFAPSSTYYTNLATDNAFSYICGGDPALELWTCAPQTLTDIDVSSAGSSITVSSGSDGFYLSIVTVDGELVENTLVAGNSYTFTKPADTFYFSVRRQDHVPFVVFCDSESNTLQDATLRINHFYDNTPFAAGEGVDNVKPIGDVIVGSGNTLFIQNGTGGVLLDNGFECQDGARLEIK